MTATAEILGTAPARNLDEVVAGLTRLRREWDMDDETRQSRGMGTYLHPDIVRVRLIDELLSWIKLDEDAALDAVDRELQRAKEQLLRAKEARA